MDIKDGALLIDITRCAGCRASMDACMESHGFTGDPYEVVYDSSRCIGAGTACRTCPFNVPRYEWNRAVPSVVKCDGCIDRVRRGESPACAEACPAEGTLAGTRGKLLREAHRRIEEDPDS